jgi:hypothetical protein
MARVIIQLESSDNVRNLVELALENQLRVLTVGIAKTKGKLSEFERVSGMESSAFYEKFGQGKLGDDFKYVRWAGEYETLKRLEKDYQDLQGIELCS